MKVLGRPDLAPLVHLLVTGVSVLVVGKVMPGIQVRSYSVAVLFACLIALLNALAFSHLTTLRGVPPWVTGAGGSLVLTALVFYVAGKLTPGVRVSGCLTAALAAAAVAFVNGLLEALVLAR